MLYYGTIASLSFTTAAPSQFCSVCEYAVQTVEALALKEEPGMLFINTLNVKYSSSLSCCCYYSY